MRRLLVSCSLASLLIVSTVAPATAVVQHRYRGRTSAGSGIELVTLGRGAGLRIQRVSVATPNRIWRCEDHHHRQGFRGITYDFGREGEPLGPGRSFRWFTDTSVYDLSGTVGPQRAFGTFLDTFVEDDEGDTCTTGPLTWEVHRTSNDIGRVDRQGAHEGWIGR